MDLDSLLNSTETAGLCGNVISTEEGIVLNNSLLLLQNENHFRKVYFWGRICGSDKDYYIAFGYVKDALVGKVYYYSTNCVDWGLLPSPTDTGKMLTPLCRTQFQGDPAVVIDMLVDKDETSLGRNFAQQILKLKEEDRLSCTVFSINEEATAMPRGALFKRPDGVVYETQGYEGMSPIDSFELKCYLHWRKPRNKWNTNLLTRSDYNYALDFLDTLDGDMPEGCWSIQKAAGGTVVVLTSLYWPGMMVYNYVNKAKYGFVYFGNGRKTLDLTFMLNPL